MDNLERLILKFAYEVKKSHNKIKYDDISSDGRPCRCDICKEASDILSINRRKLQAELEKL